MLPTQQPHETTLAVVRLGLGAAVIVLGVHIIFAGLRSLLNVWVALTPSQDRQWDFSRSRA